MSDKPWLPLLTRITDKIKKEINPEKVILFGSHAYGRSGKDSDLDILVVTRDEHLPKSFKERMAVHLEVSKKLVEFYEEVAIDLIVHTKAMHKRFIELDSMFARKILRDGKVLL